MSIPPVCRPPQIFGTIAAHLNAIQGTYSPRRQTAHNVLGLSLFPQGKILRVFCHFDRPVFGVMDEALILRLLNPILWCWLYFKHQSIPNR